MEYAGWHENTDDNFAYTLFYDEDIDTGMRGCLASRYVFLRGI